MKGVAPGLPGSRVGLYGGSFDPIHEGHVLPVQEARRSLGLDRVIYLPTANPPHKTGRRLAPAEHRLAMVELALSDRPELEISTFEMGTDGPSYTVRTLEHFLDQAGARLYLILGADSFVTLHRWRRFPELPELAELVVLARPGWGIDRERLDPILVDAVDRGRVHVVANRPLAASSTEIRSMLASGLEPPADWIRPAVVDYARRHGLYRRP